MKKDAIISKDLKYRYLLTRIWDDKKPLVVFIGLNPSTANALDDDPTIRKCISFANSWGYGGFYMLNLFAYRETKPEKMLSSANPIGPENNYYLQKYSQIVEKVVCVWGNYGSFKQRSKFVLNLLTNAYVLKLNKSGEPAHPLYLPSNLVPKNINDFCL